MVLCVIDKMIREKLHSTEMQMKFDVYWITRNKLGWFLTVVAH